MSNIQGYRGLVNAHGRIQAVQEGGASLSWNTNWINPRITGNYALRNYAEGVQSPQLNINYVPLDIANSIILDLEDFTIRSDDAVHDVSPLTAGGFWDGSSGWSIPTYKPNGVTISCSKGAPLSIQANYGVYAAAGNEPVYLTALSGGGPFGAYTYANPFAGSPFTWQHLSFYTGTPGSDVAVPPTALEGVTSFQLSFSNNLTPDPSMVSTANGKFPIDQNAGMWSGSFSVSFTGRSNTADHLATGDSFCVVCSGANAEIAMMAYFLQVEGNRSRQLHSGRVMRTYSGTLLGYGSGGAGTNMNKIPVLNFFDPTP